MRGRGEVVVITAMDVDVDDDVVCADCGQLIEVDELGIALVGWYDGDIGIVCL
jgi:hypothetical protein